MAFQGKDHRHAFSRIHVVVDNQDLPARGSVRGGTGDGLPRRRVRQRHPDDKLAPRTSPGAERGHGAAVQFDQASNKGQANSQAACRAFECGLCLREHVEDRGQMPLFDTDARVANRARRHRAVAPRADVNGAACRGEFRRVDKEVENDLGDAGDIGVEPKRLIFELEGQCLLRRCDERPGRLDGALDRVVQHDRSKPQTKLALCDPGHLEEVLHQPRDLRQLPLEHFV